MECKNCGNTFEGKFCNNCGQKADTHRFTLKHYLHEALHTFTHLDTGIIHLIKELAIRPGEVAREYIAGARKRYFSPMQFLVLGIGATTFLAITLKLMGASGGSMQGVSGSAESVADFFRQYNIYFYKFYNIIQFISVPALSFLSFLFFKSSKYNYAENLVLNTFLSGERCVIYIMFVPLFYFFKTHYFIITGLYMLAFAVYFVRSYMQFFNPSNKIVGVLKSISVIIIYVAFNQVLSYSIFLTFFFQGELRFFK